ncbi:MAG: hypothetical protein IH984_11010 [Planctomycetes bacterium]|nr:hypothetical protein [Planctomycetota bacterium]
MEHRAKLIDIAAFLDRYDRAEADTADDDFRIEAIRKAIEILGDNKQNRAKRILELLSDHSSEPVTVAGMQGAFGANPNQTDQEPNA